MTGRLIEADALYTLFVKMKSFGELTAKKAIRCVEEAPTVEAEPVRHGHWKPFDEDEYTCSLCGNIFVTMDGEHPLSNEFKYCPFCGAKMDAKEKENE